MASFPNILLSGPATVRRGVDDWCRERARGRTTSTTAALAHAARMRCPSVQNEGRLEISSDAVLWVSRAGDAKREVPLANVKAAAWYDTGRAFQLWLTDNAGELYRFDGFKSIDFERVGTAISAGSGGAVKLVKRALGTKGQNWGTLRVNGAVPTTRSSCARCGGAWAGVGARGSYAVLPTS